MGDTFRNWFNRPFDPNGSVLNWALFVLLMLVLVSGWRTVLGYITRSASALPQV